MARTDPAGYLALKVGRACALLHSTKAITMLRLIKYLPVIIPLVTKFAKDPRVKAAIAKARAPKRQQ
jgi:hypothetical protein